MPNKKVLDVVKVGFSENRKKIAELLGEIKSLDEKAINYLKIALEVLK